MTDEQEQTDVIDDVCVYTMGLVYCSVCTSLPPEEMLKRVNEASPSGTTHGWMLSKDPRFGDGTPQPCPCNQFPETHKHYLLVC